MKLQTSSILLLFFILFFISCKKQNSNYLISPTEFKEIIKNKDTSIVYFYTDWCSGKHNILNSYLTDLKTIQERNLNAQIILVASDNNISDSTIASFNDLGFVSLRINAGRNAFINRRKIKKFIDLSFPKNDIKDLKKNRFHDSNKFMGNKKWNYFKRTKIS